MNRRRYNPQQDIDEFERKARKSKKSRRPVADDPYANQHRIRPYEIQDDDYAELNWEQDPE